MSKIMYRASSNYRGIEKFEVVKETEHFIIYMNGRFENKEKKIAHDYGWFDTFLKAKEFLMNQFNVKAASYQAILDSCKASKQKINNMQESDIKDKP